MTPRTCRTCGKTFTPKQSHNPGVYCSPECRNAPRPPTEYLCHHCGKVFKHRYLPDNPRAPRYCSPNCANLARRKYTERTCPICGTQFRPYYSGQKYCAQECKFEAHRRKGLITCAQCGKPFKRSKKDTLYCSARCYGDSMLSPHPRKGKEFSRAVRRAIKERDGHACVLCGASRRLEIDHIVPVSLGGDNSIDNGQTLCHDCHRSKSLQQRKLVLAGSGGLTGL